MKVLLLDKNKNFDFAAQPTKHSCRVAADLELDILITAMSGDNQFSADICRKIVLSGTTDLGIIEYRQAILKDCLNNPEIIKNIYQLIESVIANKTNHYYIIARGQPTAILHSAIEIIQMFSKTLKTLTNLLLSKRDRFHSTGFKRLTAMLEQELNESFFTNLKHYLKELQFHNGVLFNVDLGRGNRGENYTLWQDGNKRPFLSQRAFSPKQPSYSFQINENDESGIRALAELKAKGINQVADNLAQTSVHIVNFMESLRMELTFYIGCLKLHEQLEKYNLPLTLPVPTAVDSRQYNFTELYDPVLALTTQSKTVANTLNAGNSTQLIITGANQGGKSTFLRSIGLAQLMMQSGMFIVAESFSANVCDQIFSHYCREEDVMMSHGKLDEELLRMNGIIATLTTNSLLLLNESFAATNEREGSEIARQIITALREKSVKLCFVTHLYDFADNYYRQQYDDVVFLRAERVKNGQRSFKLKIGKPLQTSYGTDLYRQIFGE